MIDSASYPGAWQRAIDRGCLNGRIIPDQPTQPHHHSSDMLGEQGRGLDTVQHRQGVSR